MISAIAIVCIETKAHIYHLGTRVRQECQSWSDCCSIQNRYEFLAVPVTRQVGDFDLCETTVLAYSFDAQTSRRICCKYAADVRTVPSAIRWFQRQMLRVAYTVRSNRNRFFFVHVIVRTQGVEPEIYGSNRDEITTHILPRRGELAKGWMIGGQAGIYVANQGITAGNLPSSLDVQRFESVLKIFGSLAGGHREALQYHR